MGGKGTYSTGKSPVYTYSHVGTIAGVKILKPINETKAYKLPEESHSANTSYVLLDKNGVFHQYREYNENHEVVFEIGYHHEPSFGRGDILHAHIHTKPGVANHNAAKRVILHPGHPIYEKYKVLFKGVKS